jgi:4-oxalocrotonate tautomerase
MQDITAAVVKNFNAPADAVVVTIVESEAVSKSKGGVPFSER